MPNLELFKKIHMFQDLTDDELRLVTRLASRQTFPAEAIILKEGEAGDSMYVMNQGEVEVTKRLTMVLDKETPNIRSMGHLRAENGVSFGEMALLEKDVRSATVTAVTDCHLLEFKRDEFLEFVRQQPVTGCKIMIRLAQLLSQRLRKTNQDVVKLTTALAIALGG